MPQRIPLFGCILAICLCAVVRADFKPHAPPSGSPTGIVAYEQTASVRGYSEATAHEPNFKDKALWPKLSGKEQFLTQQWPKGRLYVWAKPGESAAGGKGHLDPTDPANWLVDGKPASELTFDETADLLLPAADKSYEVGFRGTSISETVRHLTVENNAGFRGGGDGKGRQIFGNVWIKKGGQIYSQGATRFLGGTHTFFRNDNAAETHLDKHNRRHQNLSAQYFQFNKGEGSSIEFLGFAAVLDEFGIANGTVIVGPDSKLMPGRNASPNISAGATLALMDGAVFMKWANEFGNRDMDCAGTIQGGLPDRPLTKPAYFFVNFKNHTDAQYDGPGAESKRGEVVRYVRTPSLILRETAVLRSHSASPQAKLQIDWSGDTPGPTWRPPPAKGEKDQRTPDQLQRAPWFESLPRGITIYFAKGATVENVEFDHVLPGGLLLQDPADRAKWKDVSFGQHNLAEGDKLIQQAELARNNSY